MIKIGDVFQIPLLKNRFGYGQYVHRSPLGTILIVFSQITEGELINLALLNQTSLLFPPVLVGINAAIKLGLWQKIGRLSAGDFSKTQFIDAFWDQRTGEIYNWSLWDGKTFIKLGKVLPEKYKNHEFCVVWNPEDISRRIEIQEMPFPFIEMIRDGKFPLMQR